jgi:L-2-hydroxyglutarate oxidase LhgO
MDRVGVAVIGAGVVGLAVAERLSRRYGDLVVVERQDGFGRETSSRNSEVIHAGLYYGSQLWKTRLCLRGNPLLYELCAREGIACRRTGKIVAAAGPEELPVLEDLAAQARANGVQGVRLLGAREVAALEPQVRAAGGLFSQDSGIVDSHGLMSWLERQALSRGAVFAYGCTVQGLSRAGGGYVLEIRDADGQRLELAAERVVNCAGLGAERIAGLAGIDTAAAGYRVNLCKGEYFSLSSRFRGAFRHLIYPVPSPLNLGAHVVLSLGEGVRIGPNAFFVEEVEYSVDAGHREAFWAEARKLLPDLTPGDLTPDMAGIRPKLYRDGEPFRDFVIREEGDRGLPGFIDLIGMESPGLTSCLAIAERVEELVRGRGAVS